MAYCNVSNVTENSVQLTLKGASNLTNYETKTTAEGKYAQKATTLAGYGITNAYTKTEADSKFITKDVSDLTNYTAIVLGEASSDNKDNTSLSLRFA